MSKTFLITGASSGIGAATARLAARAGYRLALAARSADRLDGLVAELGGPDRALAIRCDVTDYADQARMVAATQAAFGSIDVAFVNAGVGVALNPHGIAAGDPDNWREMVLTNLLGTAYTCKAVLPAIKEAKGLIIVTGSHLGRKVTAGSVYGATKWGVTGLAYNLQEELSGSGARATILHPSLTNTGFSGRPRPEGLDVAHVANAVMQIVQQPPELLVAEMMLLPNHAGARQPHLREVRPEDEDRRILPGESGANDD